RDEKTLTRLAREEKVEDLPPASVLLLVRALRGLGRSSPFEGVFFIVSPDREAVGGELLALEVLQRAQARHPGDFWINLELGHCLASLAGKTPKQAADAVGFLRVALAFRPRSPELHADLGFALKQQGALAEAEQVLRRAFTLYQEALRGNPQDAVAH